MRERRRGHISWIASIAGYGGLPGGVSYGASKAALIHMAETVKMGLEKEGIDISIINPGFVRTAMTAPNKHPMPFLMEPEDAAVKIVAGLKAKKFENRLSVADGLDAKIFEPAAALAVFYHCETDGLNTPARHTLLTKAFTKTGNFCLWFIPVRVGFVRKF